MLKYPQWQLAQIVAHGIFIILFAENAVITEVSWQLRRTRQFKKLITKNAEKP